MLSYINDMYVCMCVCVCVRVCVCACVRACVRARASTHARTYVCMYVQVHVQGMGVYIEYNLTPTAVVQSCSVLGLISSVTGTDTVTEGVSTHKVSVNCAAFKTAAFGLSISTFGHCLNILCVLETWIKRSLKVLKEACPVKNSAAVVLIILPIQYFCFRVFASMSGSVQ